jgi:S1-C subfamily serine protease
MAREGAPRNENPPAVEEAPPPVVISSPEPKRERHVRRVMRYAVAFPVSESMLVTSSAVVNGATEITLQTRDGDTISADVVRADSKSGLALIRAKKRMSATLSLADAFAGGGVIGVGFPEVSLFDPVASSITGNAPRPQGNWKVRMNKNPRLPGAPLIVNNAVVGVLLATRDDSAADCPAATLDQLKEFVGKDAQPLGTPRDLATCVYQIIATRQTTE